MRTSILAAAGLAAAGTKLNDLFLAVSLANLCFIRRWYELGQLQTRSMDYFRTGPAGSTLAAATMIAVVMLAAVFFLLAQLVRWSGRERLRTVARCGFILTAVFPVETIRRYWNAQALQVDWGSNLALVALELMLLSGAGMALAGNLRILRSLERVLLTMVFLVPALLLEAALNYAVAEAPSSYFSKPGLPLLPARAGLANGPAPRFIWLLFDELDQRLVFEERQPGVQLP